MIFHRPDSVMHLPIGLTPNQLLAASTVTP